MQYSAIKSLFLTSKPASPCVWCTCMRVWCIGAPDEILQAPGLINAELRYRTAFRLSRNQAKFKTTEMKSSFRAGVYVRHLRQRLICTKSRIFSPAPILMIDNVLLMRRYPPPRI